MKAELTVCVLDMDDNVLANTLTVCYLTRGNHIVAFHIFKWVRRTQVGSMCKAVIVNSVMAFLT